jgi:transcription termination factor NusB
MDTIIELSLELSESKERPDFFELPDDIEIFSNYVDNEKHEESMEIFAEVLDPANEKYKDTGMFERFKMLMIMFLKGEIYSNPFHLGPVDPETIPLLKNLILINEAGFVTLEGQPGECGFERINKKRITSKRLDKIKKLSRIEPFANYGKFVEEEQRAYMSGFICDPRLIAKLEKHLDKCAVFSVKLSEPPSTTRVKVSGDTQRVKKYTKDGVLGLTRSRLAGEAYDDYESNISLESLAESDFLYALEFLNETLENSDDIQNNLYNYLKSNCYYVTVVKLVKCRKLEVEVLRALKMRD